MDGGGTGIRTQETLSRLTVFKTRRLHHSAIPPLEPAAPCHRNPAGGSDDVEVRPPRAWPAPRRVAAPPDTRPTLRESTRSAAQIPGPLRAVATARTPGRAVMTSTPRMYGRNASGTTTEPSARWKFSRIAMRVRPTARPEPLRGVDELGLALAVGAVLDAGPARLEGLGVAARRDLPVLALSRQPHLDVVGLGGREPMSRVQRVDRAVGQAQALQDRLGVAGQGLQASGTSRPAGVNATSSTLSNWCWRISPRTSAP